MRKACITQSWQWERVSAEREDKTQLPPPSPPRTRQFWSVIQDWRFQQETGAQKLTVCVSLLPILTTCCLWSELMGSCHLLHISWAGGYRALALAERGSRQKRRPFGNKGRISGEPPPTPLPRNPLPCPSSFGYRWRPRAQAWRPLHRSPGSLPDLVCMWLVRVTAALRLMSGEETERACPIP